MTSALRLPLLVVQIVAMVRAVEQLDHCPSVSFSQMNLALCEWP